MADFDLRFILPNQLNPELIPKIGVPIARPSNIIDDPMAAYRQSMKNAFAPNILEGVNNFRAIVLLRETTKDGLILNQDVNTEGYKDPEVETEEDKKQKSPTNVQFQQPQQDLTLLTCMIPELHLHLPNPFQAGDVETYLKIVKAFYPKFPFPNGSVPDINTTEILAGSVVEIRFDDPNKSIGYVTGVKNKASNNLIQQLLHSSAQGRTAFESGSPASNPARSLNTPFVSARYFPATSDEIYEAYAPAMTRELAQEIVDLANSLGVDPAWIANLMNFETKGEFNSSVQNPYSDATGLIQFMPDTAEGLGTTIDDLAAMSTSEQMKFVEQYFQDQIDTYGSLNSPADTFMAVFYPPAIGQGPDFDIYEHARTVGVPSPNGRKVGKAFADAILEQNRGIRYVRDYEDMAFGNSKILN
jgi:hypothetical protein